MAAAARSLLLVHVLVVVCVSAVSPVVQTEAGPVRGAVDAETGVARFLGIPFAAPPSGANRWRPPQPVQPWGPEPRNATEWGNICFPVGKSQLIPDKSGTKGEDCLSVNVFVPPTVPGGGLKPVLCFIHGGGFTLGSARHSNISPEPSLLALASDTVFVSLQYRLGALGFLLTDEAEGQDGVAGNYGLLDQQAALRWVQRNIERFGGDPRNVTLMGESAGAFSECAHLAMPGSAGLFARVIMMSPMCDFGFQPRAEALAQSRRAMAAVGCADLACMRRADALDVQGSLETKRGLLFFEGVRWFPSVDGKTLPVQPIAALRDGTAHRTDVMIGSNTDEGSMFIFIAFPLWMPNSLFDLVVDHTFAAVEQQERLKRALPASWSARRKVTKLFNDMFSCSLRRTARHLARLNRDEATSEVFLYHYALVPHTVPFPLSTLGAFHGSELRLLFRRAKGLNDKELAVADTMVHFWSRFVHSGNANLPYMEGEREEARWPEYDEEEELYWTFNETSPDHVDVRSAKRHLQSQAVPVEGHWQGEEPDPFALCAFFDQLVNADGTVPAPQVFEEPLDSWLVNVVLVRRGGALIKRWWKLGVGLALALMAWAVARRRGGARGTEQKKKTQ